MDAGATYASLMAACEKAGQWGLAVALFDTMSARVPPPATWYKGFRVLEILGF